MVIMAAVLGWSIHMFTMLCAGDYMFIMLFVPFLPTVTLSVKL